MDEYFRPSEKGYKQSGFPAIDLILVITLFVKLGMSYFEYRKHGQMEWTPAVVLFASLVFTLTALLCVWTVLGM